MGNSGSKAEDPIDVTKGSKYWRERQNLPDELTPTERVKALFERNEYGDPSPEFYTVLTSVTFGFIGGFLFGGFPRVALEREEFFRSFNHEKWETPRFAQKALTDRIMRGFISGGLAMGWRMAAFTGMYTFVQLLVSAYRGKRHIADHVAGGATAGFLYKLKEGPKPTIAGMIIGGALGCVSGTMEKGFAYMAGSTPDEIMQHGYKGVVELQEDQLAGRKNQRNEQREYYKASDPESILLTEFHERYVADDDRSMATVKGSEIQKLIADAEKGEVFADILPLVPKAAEGKLKTVAEFGKQQAEAADKAKTTKSEPVKVVVVSKDKSVA